MFVRSLFALLVCSAGCAAGSATNFDNTSGDNPPQQLGGGNGGTLGGKGNGQPEICNGKDDDGNGIIDDVDVGHDGVCDCLTVATLGKPFSPGSSVFKTWLNSRSNMGAVDLDTQTLTPSLLAPYKIIVTLDVSNAGGGQFGRDFAPSEVQALHDWVNAGGGLMTMVVGFIYAPEVENVNALLAAYDMGYDGNHGGTLLGGGHTLPVTHWVPHPLTEGITAIGMDNGYPVKGTGSMLASEQGWQVLEAREVGMGHVVSWGDEWITFDSEWSMHPDYQVAKFWVNIFKWLTKSGDCQVPKGPN